MFFKFVQNKYIERFGLNFVRLIFVLSEFNAVKNAGQTSSESGYGGIVKNFKHKLENPSTLSVFGSLRAVANEHA